MSKVLQINTKKNKTEKIAKLFHSHQHDKPSTLKSGLKQQTQTLLIIKSTRTKLP